MDNFDLAAALSDLIAQAAPPVPREAAPSLEDAFAALLASASLEPAPIQDDEAIRIS
jgi:hypothetical protein